jgi:hypothetical protein
MRVVIFIRGHSHATSPALHTCMLKADNLEYDTKSVRAARFLPMRSYPGFYTPQILSPRTIWLSYRNMQGQIEGESNAPRSIAETARLCSRASTYRHEGCSGDFQFPQICVCMHGNGNHPKYNKDTHLMIRQEDGRFGWCSWLYASCSGCKALY